MYGVYIYYVYICGVHLYDVVALYTTQTRPHIHTRTFTPPPHPQLWDWENQRVMTAPGGGQYLLPYLGERFARLARQLRTWPFPRGHYKYAQYIRSKGSVFWLVDRRFCPLLPVELRVVATQGLHPVVAGQGQDCEAACRCGYPGSAASVVELICGTYVPV